VRVGVRARRGRGAGRPSSASSFLNSMRFGPAAIDSPHPTGLYSYPERTLTRRRVGRPNCQGKAGSAPQELRPNGYPKGARAEVSPGCQWCQWCQWSQWSQGSKGSKGLIGSMCSVVARGHLDSREGFRGDPERALGEILGATADFSGRTTPPLLISLTFDSPPLIPPPFDPFPYLTTRPTAGVRSQD